MTYGLPIEQQSMPTIDFLREQINMSLVAFNSTINPATSEEPQPIGLFSFISFPDDWMSLTIDDLRAYYIDQIRTLFEQFMVQVDSYLEQFELLGGFDKLSLKAIIDHIGDEVELIPGGPKGVPINITIEIKVPMSDWVNLTDMLELDIFQYYQIYILDPTTFSVDTGALIEQFLSTGTLFIGKGYDWSGIVKEYEFPGPGSDRFLNFDMNWNTKGVLDHIRLEYDEQVVASIKLRTTTTELGGISGYNLLIFAGITLFSIGVLITSIKKRKTKF
jgi:hypothetical protein